MRKKKLIALAVIILLFVAGGIILSPSTPQPEVIGNLSSKDVSEIRNAFYHYFWSTTFPDCSSKSLKNLPWAIKARLRTHLVRVETTNGNTAFATFEPYNPVSGYEREKCRVKYLMLKDSKCWRLVGAMSLSAPVP